MAEKTITLKKSKLTATFDDAYTTDAVIAAQKASKRRQDLVPVYVIQNTVTFDGRRWTAGEIRQKLPGRDYFQLLQELFVDDADGEAASEDDEGE
jgi:protein-disulfide isomerase-like protein with CxxC motif